MQYGQFCPVSKATEILGDKWTLLIVRELLMGASRFNTLQRGLSSISPTMLTKRLNELCACGIVMKKKIPGQKGYEYFLTPSGQELLPVLEAVGVWGMRWAREGPAHQNRGINPKTHPKNQKSTANPIKFRLLSRWAMTHQGIYF